MTPFDRQVSENVLVLMHRANVSQTALAERLGIGRMSLGQRLKGRTAWRAEDVAQLAELFYVTNDEITGTLPTYREWVEALPDSARK